MYRQQDKKKKGGGEEKEIRGKAKPEKRYNDHNRTELYVSFGLMVVFEIPSCYSLLVFLIRHSYSYRPTERSVYSFPSRRYPP